MPNTKEEQKPARASRAPSRVVFNPEVEELVRDAKTGFLTFQALNLDREPRRRSTMGRSLSASRSMPLRASTIDVILGPQFSTQSNLPSFSSSLASAASAVESAMSTEPTLQREYGQTDINVLGESTTVLQVDPTLATEEIASQTIEEVGWQNPPARESYMGRKSLNLPGPGESENEDPYALGIPLIPTQEVTDMGHPTGDLQVLLGELNTEFQQVRGSLAEITVKLEKYLSDHLERTNTTSDASN